MIPGVEKKAGVENAVLKASPRTSKIAILTPASAFS